MTRLDRVELVKIVVAASILLSIVFFSILQIQVYSPQRTEKLVVMAMSRPYVDEEAVLRVAVVNEEGMIVEGRDDLVEISVLTKGASVIGTGNDSDRSWSKKLQTRLKGGMVDILFKGLDQEPATITVRQVEGDSPLNETSVTIVPHPG
ncbi:MAG: hypothetical protein QXO25_05285 [Candidatus Bathyarchaeia archaeon]